MKPLHRTPNTIKSLTLRLSLAEGVEIADLQNKRYRLTVPLNGLVFDNHAATPAWFYALFPPQLGNGAVPVPGGIRLVSHHLVMSGADNDDPRQAIVSRLVLDLEFADDAQTFTALPLVIKGTSTATNAPAAFSLPAFTPSVDAPFVVADANGGALAAGIAVEALGMPQGDADTLQGEDGDYYLSRANHTGTQAISTVSGLQDALDGKAAVSHTHSISEVSSLSAALDDLMEATLPPGGTTGQVLAKNSGTHYDVDWVDASGGGGGGGNADTLQGEDGDHYLSRANHTGAQAISTVSGLQTALDGKAAASHTHDDRYYTETETDNLLSDKADLVGGVVPTSQLPAIAIGETFSVASQSAMLALDAQHGDVAIRTDESGKKYLLLDDDPTTLANWTALGAAGGAVASVNSQTGDVVLGYSDVGAAPASTATSLSSHTGNTSNPHSVTKSQVGLGNANNTSDADKPVSDATQDALDLKLDATPESFATLTDGATITWNSQGKPTVNATVTLGGNRTLSISNAASGTSGILIVKQDGSGNRTLTLPAGSIVVDGGGGAVALSPGPASIDVLSFIYDGTNFLWSYGKTFN